MTEYGLQSPNPSERAYLNLMKEILEHGVVQQNRTGIDTFMIPGAMLKYDLTKGFPAVTSKQLFFNPVKGELLGFLRGYTNSKQFEDLGCRIWNQNANENEAWVNNLARYGEGDLGYIYSRLWTDMPHEEQHMSLDAEGRIVPGYQWNQIDKLIEGIKKDPTSRRLIVSAWHPEVFHKAALPPCHVLFQVIIDQARGLMHMSMYQRSCDMFLGVPFNVASYALLTHMLAGVTGYTPGTFTWFGADCHIYENHVEQVKEQISRTVYPAPKLGIDFSRLKGGTDISKLEPSDISMLNYQSHGPLKAPMAV